MLYVNNTDIGGSSTGNMVLSNSGVPYAFSNTSLASKGGLLINIDSATGDIARTTDGLLENNEALGIWAENIAPGVSIEADTAVTRTGLKTLKLSTTDATGRAGATLNLGQWTGASVTVPNIYKNAIKLKASTKYKITCWVKTNNVATNSAYIAFDQFDTSGTRLVTTSSSFLSGTNDWSLLSINKTTNASASFGTVAFLNIVAGNISDAWFDINSMTLEEVVEPVANSLITRYPSLVSFSSVGSTDNIDQSQTSATNQTVVGDAAGVDYMNSQSFTPTKSKHTGVVLYKKANSGTPTGNFKVDVRTDDGSGNPTSTILATYTIPLATYNALTTNADFTVPLPCNLTPGTKYHYVMSSTVSEGTGNAFILGSLTAGGYTGGDARYSINGGTTWVVDGVSDRYFKTLYYKPTTNFKASQNNQTVSISADEDGFLNGSTINLTTGTFSVPDLIKTKWDGTSTDYAYTGKDVNKFLAHHSANNVSWEVGTSYNIVAPKSSTEGSGYVVRIKLPIDITNLNISYAGNSTVGTSIVRYSYDLSSWTTLGTSVHETEFVSFTQYKSYSFTPTGNTVYIEFGLISGGPRIGSIVISGNIDTSSLPILYNYPTNKSFIRQYTTTLGSPTTTATYRATKWGFPAIEYSSTEYQYLDIDTTATGSVVKFSELGASFTTVADGASLTITSTSTPTIYVDHNITANRLYLSSNDFNASSDKDGSLLQTIGYQY